MKRGQAWYFAVIFLFMAVFFIYALFPIMQNVMNSASGTLPSSQIAFGGFLLFFVIVGVAFTFWKIIAPASS